MSKVPKLKITVNAEELGPKLRISAPSTGDFQPVEDLETFDNGEGLDFGTNFFADSTDTDENVRFHVNLDAKAEEQLFPEIFDSPPNSARNRQRNPAVASELIADDSRATDDDINSVENRAKRLARAKRFGIEGTDDDWVVSDEKLRSLYASFGLDQEIGEKRTANSEKYRLDTIFVRGVQEMNSRDVFSYFSEYPPDDIEWVNDLSCNVVWGSKCKAAKAMLSLSKPLKRLRLPREQEEGEVSSGDEDVEDYVSPMKRGEENVEKEKIILTNEEGEGEKLSTNEDDEKISSTQDQDDEEEEENGKIDEDVVMLGVDESSVREIEKEVEALEKPTNSVRNSLGEETIEVDVREHTVPPGQWRVGIRPCSKAALLLFRFSTINDVKVRGAQYESNYYRKYGNPNLDGELRLVSESRKRKMMGIPQSPGYFVDEDQAGDLRKRIDSRKILRYRRRRPRPAFSSDCEEENVDDYPDVISSHVPADPYKDSDDSDADSVSMGRPRTKQPPRMKMRADDEEMRSERRRNRYVTGGREYTPPTPDYYSDYWDHDMYGLEYEDLDAVDSAERGIFEGAYYTVGEDFDYSEEFLKDEDREKDLPDWSELAAKKSKKWTPPSDLKRMKVTVENR